MVCQCFVQSTRRGPRATRGCHDDRPGEWTARLEIVAEGESRRAYLQPVAPTNAVPLRVNSYFTYNHDRLSSAVSCYDIFFRNNGHESDYCIMCTAPGDIPRPDFMRQIVRNWSRYDVVICQRYLFRRTYRTAQNSIRLRPPSGGP